MKKAGQYLFRGSAAHTFALLLNTISALVLTPYLVNGLGDRFYGAWVIVMSLLGYYGLLDLGLIRAMVRYIALNNGKSDHTETEKYLKAGLIMFIGCGLLAAALTVISVILTPLFFKDHDPELIRFLILLLGLTVAFTFPARCFEGVLRAHLRHDLISAIDVLYLMARTTGIIIALYHNGKLPALTAVASLSLIIRYAGITFAAKKVHGSFGFARMDLDYRYFRELLSFGIASFITKLEDMLRLNSYPFIISWGIGLIAVTPYAIAEKLRLLMTEVGRAILMTTEPFFSQLEGAGDNKSMIYVFLFLYKISCYLSVLLSGMIFIFGHSFILLWMGPDHLDSVQLLYIMAAGTGLILIQLPTVNMLFGTGKQQFYAATNGLSAFGCLIISLLSAKYYGLPGIAVGMTFFPAIIANFVQPLLVCRELKMSIAFFHMKYTLPNLLKPLSFMLIFYLMIKSFKCADFISLLILSALGCLCFIPFIYYIGFNLMERKLTLKSIFQGNSG